MGNECEKEYFMRFNNMCVHVPSCDSFKIGLVDYHRPKPILLNACLHLLPAIDLEHNDRIEVVFVVRLLQKSPLPPPPL